MILSLFFCLCLLCFFLIVSVCLSLFCSSLCLDVFMFEWFCTVGLYFFSNVVELLNDMKVLTLLGF